LFEHIDDYEIEEHRGKLNANHIKRLAELEKWFEDALRDVKRLQAEYEHKPTKPTKPKLTLVKP
jgi:hypothetical protein